ncbi:hypothetical protein TWF718_005126 [Orbilia javanica]|uniref:Uncharacterized protein n=1 Tax=Orbilia javanica TaxID=47235 RepID=A0AAN8MT59_9PEZI
MGWPRAQAPRPIDQPPPWIVNADGQFRHYESDIPLSGPDRFPEPNYPNGLLDGYPGWNTGKPWKRDIIDGDESNPRIQNAVEEDGNEGYQTQKDGNLENGGLGPSGGGNERTGIEENFDGGGVDGNSRI